MLFWVMMAVGRLILLSSNAKKILPKTNRYLIEIPNNCY